MLKMSRPILPNIEIVLLEKQSGRFERLRSITLLDKRPGMICRGKMQREYPSTDLPMEVGKFAKSVGVDFTRIVLVDGPVDEAKILLEELKQAEPFDSYLENNAWPGPST